jgi:alkylglycerol monooxygenase
VHTREIDRLGPFEHVFNTPSHHRVHHGKDPKYIDKNYGGMFIVWDRLFGTFQAEEEEPSYGTVKPVGSGDPLWANLQVWDHLVRMARAPIPWRDRWMLWVKPPEWQPAIGARPALAGTSAPAGTSSAAVAGAMPAAARSDALPAAGAASPGAAPPAQRTYVTVSFGSALIGSTLLVLAMPQLAWWQRGLGAGLVVWTLVSWSALLERRRHALRWEQLRLWALPIGSLGLLWDHPTRLPISAAIGVGAWLMARWLPRCARQAARTPDFI